MQRCIKVYKNLGDRKLTEKELISLYFEVSERFENNLPTLFTSQYDKYDYKALIDALSPSEYAKVYAAGIVSRLIEMHYEVVYVTDYEKKKDESKSREKPVAKRKARVPVIQIASDGHTALAEYESLTLAGKAVGASPSEISDSAKRHRKCRGYYWRRKDSITDTDLLFWQNTGERIFPTQKTTEKPEKNQESPSRPKQPKMLQNHTVIQW